MAGGEMMRFQDHSPCGGQFHPMQKILPDVNQEDCDEAKVWRLLGFEALEHGDHNANLNQLPLSLNVNAGQVLPRLCDANPYADRHTNGTSSRMLGRTRSMAAHPNERDHKLKAASIPVFSISIGSWEKKEIYKGDLVAKFYYNKHKIIWEFLDHESDHLKNKMEIDWDDIIGILAETSENGPGILEIELRRQPTFYKELQPQPKKHSTWVETTDFTNGQALINRRHQLVFLPGNLNKPLETLLRCNTRLKALSRGRFPTSVNPYFAEYSFKVPQEFTVSMDKELQTQPDCCGFGLPYASNTNTNTMDFVPAQKNFKMQEPMSCSSDSSLQNYAFLTALKIQQEQSIHANYGAAPLNIDHHSQSTIVPTNSTSTTQAFVTDQEPSMMPRDFALSQEFLSDGSVCFDVLPFEQAYFYEQLEKFTSPNSQQVLDYPELNRPCGSTLN